MSQFCIGENTGHHRFGHRHRADTNTGIMTAFGAHIDLFAIAQLALNAPFQPVFDFLGLSLRRFSHAP